MQQKLTQQQLSPPVLTAMKTMLTKMELVQFVVGHRFGRGARGEARLHAVALVSMVTGVTNWGQGAAAGRGGRLAESGGGGAAGADGVRARD